MGRAPFISPSPSISEQLYPMAHFPAATFILSAWQPAHFPPDTGAEIAFAGRSNAGKSSALNAITGRKGLARTSKTPGRTQLINFFDLGEYGRLADLPGYGYAKVPEEMRNHWRELLTRYVETRTSLAGLVLVMDARRPLTDYDWMMLEWVRDHSLAVHLLITKADKLNRGEQTQTLRNVRARTAGFATAQMFSSTTKSGLDEARRHTLRILAREPETFDPAA
jgi:GTP-binding protein